MRARLVVRPRSSRLSFYFTWCVKGDEVWILFIILATRAFLVTYSVLLLVTRRDVILSVSEKADLVW
jgi:hypothetical protein